jgi:hypothetical protein
MDRCSVDQGFSDPDPDRMRVIIVGASHAARLVGCLAKNGMKIVNYAKPERVLDESTAPDIIEE